QPQQQAIQPAGEQPQAAYYAPPQYTVPQSLPTQPPSPLANAAAYDPIAAQQLAALVQQVQALQAAAPPAAPAVPAVPAADEPVAHPTGPSVAPITQATAPPVRRVDQLGSYTTKGQGIQYSTRG
ncbi:MAG TPA: hypothetical protein VNT26_07745, partial [Candidatus Sulfotelmatobacter sp.]|nr:hypothetical protein [Candidatus Sulfotelmatobacter sp.]